MAEFCGAIHGPTGWPCGLQPNHLGLHHAWDETPEGGDWVFPEAEVRDDEHEHEPELGEESGETTRAEEPIEFRIERAYLNGFTDGLHRGTRGRLDHA